jgi:hypothetical protein
LPFRTGDKSKLKRCVFFAIVAAATLAPTISAAQLSLAQQKAGQSLLDGAWHELYSNPRESLRIFKNQLPKWAAFSKQSVGYIDADRGSLIAAVFAKDDVAAETSWKRITQETGTAVAEIEPSGDVRAWNGDWTLAFRSYRNAGHFGAAECTVQTDRGLDEAISGHLQLAMKIWLLDPVCSGPYDLTDVHLALTGDALAARNEWLAARSMWLRAARKGRVVPQLDVLYSGNIMALSMLYHYRDRFSTLSSRKERT